jgi:hypothetical protein
VHLDHPRFAAYGLSEPLFDNRLRRYDSGNGRDIAYEQSRDKLGGLTLFR